jgi:hypothetical protein
MKAVDRLNSIEFMLKSEVSSRSNLSRPSNATSEDYCLRHVAKQNRPARYEPWLVLAGPSMQCH